MHGAAGTMQLSSFPPGRDAVRSECQPGGYNLSVLMAKTCMGHPNARMGWLVYSKKAYLAHAFVWSTRASILFFSLFFFFFFF
jgi:hypothetical protein